VTSNRKKLKFFEIFYSFFQILFQTETNGHFTPLSAFCRKIAAFYDIILKDYLKRLFY
jgi:hypothetical protein